MKTIPTLAFAFIATVLLAAGSVTYEYEAPVITYGEDLVVTCVADSEDMVAYSSYQEGVLQCERHQWVEDKTRLAELKRAMPRRVQ
jgi:ethanolamine ammonia-lyase large subunit